MITKMKKWKIGAIVGGLWGLFASILYAWGIYAAAFRGYSAIGHLFSKAGFVIKSIYLPAYLADQILGIFEGQLVPFFSSLLGESGPMPWIFFFALFFVGMPLLIGSIIGGGIGYLIDKFKK